jgi:hypothetical protein
MILSLPLLLLTGCSAVQEGVSSGIADGISLIIVTILEKMFT